MPRTRTPANSKAPAVPKTVAHTSAPVVTHSLQVEKSGFFSNVWQGFGLGTGQAIAHTLFMSKPVQQQQQTNEYTQCMTEYNDKYACEKYLKTSSVDRPLSTEAVHP